MTIHLVRHGEVENPERIVYADIPGFRLSKRGRLEAAAAAQHLGSLGVTAIYSSPLDRACETADIIAAVTGAPIRPREDLTEWHVARRWKGVAWEDLPRKFPGEVEAYVNHPTNLPFAEESIEDLGLRVAEAVREIAAAHPYGAVVVSHQDPIQAGRLVLLEEPLERLHEDRPGHCEVLTLAPGSPWRQIAHWKPVVGEPQEAWPPVGGP